MRCETSGESSSASGTATVASVVAAHGEAERFSVEGPPVRLAPKATLALSMALHELMTNAAKYGSLSNESGQVRLVGTDLAGLSEDRRAILRGRHRGRWT